MPCQRLLSGHSTRSFTTVVIALLFSGSTSIGAFQGNGKKDEKVKRQNVIRISKETTRITEPLDAEGYVDYVRAINERCSAGVTPDNNFEVVVRTVMPPDEIVEELRGEYFRLLGIPVPGKNARFYRDFVSATLGENPSQDETDRILAEQDAITSQPWTAVEHPEAADWVDQYGKQLDQLVEGSKRATYYVPYLAGEVDADEPMPRMIGLLLPSVQQQREIARGLSARAMRRVGEGDLAGAWSDLQAMHRVSRHVARGFSLIESLVAVAIDSMAFQGEAHVLQSFRLTDDQARRFLADLNSLPALPPIAEKIDVGERFMGLDAAITLARHSGQHNLFKMLNIIQALSAANSQQGDSYFVSAERQAPQSFQSTIDWNVTLTMLNKWYDRLAEASRETDFDKQRALFAAIDGDLKKLAAEARSEASTAQQLLKSLATGGPSKTMGEKMGAVLVALMVPAVQVTRAAEDRAAAQSLVMRLAFAAELYRRDSGSLPDSLAQLTPRYLTAIAADPYSGASLKYVVAGNRFQIYSVGRNGVDDKGRTHEDAEREEGARPGWDDIGVRVRR